MKIGFLYVTHPNSNGAKELASELVQTKLAACVNILEQVTSVFEWKGKVALEKECVLIIKTDLDNFRAIETLIVNKHPYECPCILSIPIQGGHAPFLEFIKMNSASTIVDTNNENELE